MRLCVVTLTLLLSLPAFAGVEQLSEGEFQKLAEDLAPKVNLFRDAWEKDPSAEFYGGTTRDYLYWVKGQFRSAKTHEEALALAAKLRAQPVIDVRSFIIGESDVDVFTKESYSINPEEYGVRKVDLQSPDMLDPATELGKNERHQGFIPAEKIRLGKNGFAKPAELGDGLGEIYRGKLTLHFASPEEFAQTKYAREGLNHPILLALRYLRLEAIDYFQTHGSGLPDREKLLAALDPASAKAARAVIESALDGEELKPYLARHKFKSWINGAIQKAFRSYTNPTAAKLLMQEFQVDKLPEAYANSVETINQYVFQQFRDERAIAKNLQEFGADPAALYRPVREEFPDGKLYHGTRTQEAFRGILLQGVLGSDGGTAGHGLYGVRHSSQKFAEEWGGDKQRLLAFPVKPNARIVDIREGEGRRVWETYKARHGDNLDKFAEAFGVDLIRYPYNAEAYVVKNSGALGRAQGVYQQILPLPEILERAKTIHDPDELVRLTSINGLNDRETRRVFANAPVSPAEVLRALKDDTRSREILIRVYLGNPDFPGRNEAIASVLDKSTHNERVALAKHVFGPAAAGEIPAELWERLGRQPEQAGLLSQYVFGRYWQLPPGTPVPPEHRQLLLGMLEAGILDGTESQLLRCPGLGHQRELIEAWFARQEKLKPGEVPWGSINNLARGLNEPVYAGDQDLIRRFLRVPGGAEEFAKELALGPPPAWLLDELMNHPSSHGALVTRKFLDADFREAHQSYLDRIIEEGHADNELATRILPNVVEKPELESRILQKIVSRERPSPEALGVVTFYAPKGSELARDLHAANERVLSHLKEPADVFTFYASATRNGAKLDPELVQKKLISLLLDIAAAPAPRPPMLGGETFHANMRHLVGDWIYDATPGSLERRGLAAWLEISDAIVAATPALDFLKANPEFKEADAELAEILRKAIVRGLREANWKMPAYFPLAERLLRAVKADPGLRARPEIAEILAEARKAPEMNLSAELRGLVDDTIALLSPTAAPGACPTLFRNVEGTP